VAGNDQQSFEEGLAVFAGTYIKHAVLFLVLASAGCAVKTIPAVDAAANTSVTTAAISQPDGLGEANDKVARNESGTSDNPGPEKVFWRGRFENVTAEWTDRNFRIIDNSRNEVRTDWRKSVAEEFEARRADSQGLRCDYYVGLRVLSVVGNLATFYQEELIRCGIASWFVRIKTLDLTKAGPNLYRDMEDAPGVLLNDLFPERDILDSLERQPLLKGFLSGRSGEAKNVAELLELVQEEYVRKAFGDYALGPELDAFVFRSLTNGRVSVRLFLLPTAGYNASTTEHLDIILPVPNSLKADMEASRLSKGGFFFDSRGRERKATSEFSASF
jgi:hypothetical protein